MATRVPPGVRPRLERRRCNMLYRDVSRTRGGVVRKRSSCLHLSDKIFIFQIVLGSEPTAHQQVTLMKVRSGAYSPDNYTQQT